MKIGLYHLVSNVHDENHIDKSLHYFKKDIEDKLGFPFIDLNKNTFQKGEYFSVIFVKSGGVEDEFKKMFKLFNDNCWLLAGNLHNALPAAMEIATFLRKKGKKAEIIHGDTDYIARRIKDLYRVWEAKNKLLSVKLGVIGKPSDWLIASETDYKRIKEQLGITLVDIKMSELFREINQERKFDHDRLNDLKRIQFNAQSMDGALKIYYGLKALAEKHKLNGMTVRCFDLLEKFANTGCLGLSLLNSEGIIAGCEGDVPAMISMLILWLLTGKPVFMANPASVNKKKNEVILAHCTIPLNMPDHFQLDTHFESGLGVGIKGHIPKGKITIFKLSSDAQTFFVSGGEIIENLDDPNMCRTQIKVKLDEDVIYFLKNSIGNHHLVCKGDHHLLVKEFFNM